MSSSKAAVEKLMQRANEADEMIVFLKNQLSELKASTISSTLAQEKQRLQEENAQLARDVEIWKNKLIQLEVRNGLKQIAIPSDFVPAPTRAETSDTAKSAATPPLIEAPSPVQKQEPAKKDKGKSAGKENKSKTSGANDVDLPVDVRRLDFRIGKILTTKKHPDADALYVEEVDVGEEKCRTVVSGLVRHVPLEEMQNRLVMLLCNLKPAKMRGVTSQAMVMCASTPDRVEILEPPADSVPGDLVVCADYPREPDKELNPKKKIFEQVAPDLKTDDNRRATYKGLPLEVAGKGYVTAASLCNVQIK